MKDLAIQLYRWLLARRSLYQLNLHLYKLSLRGLGVLNAEGPTVTGEAWFQDQVAKHLDVKVVVDVGANLDVFGATTFTHAYIVACEPHPVTFKKLQTLYPDQVKRGQIKLLNIALSNKPGKLSLWDFANDAELKHTQPTSTLASLDKQVIEELHHQKAQAYSVKVSTLDQLVKQHKLSQIDILKIDTEGHEYQVLAGATNTLKKGLVSIIQFEFNEMNVLSRSFLYDFIKLLPNYQFYRLLPSGLLPLDSYRPLTHEIFGFQNIVCVHRKALKSLKFLNHGK